MTRSGKKLKKPLRVLRDFAVQHIRAGTSKKGIVTAFARFKNGFRKEGRVPELWDGKAAERIVDKLISLSASP